MPNLQEQERETYTTMWAAVDDYSTTVPGERYIPLLLQVTGSQRGTLLDAGCGSGKGAVALAAEGFDVTLCDLTDEGLSDEARALRRFKSACLWESLKPITPIWGKFDWVYCTDVLEHVPTQLTMLVVSRLLDVTRKGLFLAIYLEPDVFGAWVGKALHQTVQPYEWWKASLAEIGTLVEARDLLNIGIYVVKPR